MKKALTYLLTVLCVSLFFTGFSWADAGLDWYDTSSVHYDVTVAAPDGYVNIRYGPGTEYDIITSAKNGTVIHVEQEAAASNGKKWGQCRYNGKYGWIALSQVKKNSSKPEANSEPKAESKITTLYKGGSAADYSVKVSAPDGGLNLRYGPGTKYGILISMMPNGTILNIEKADRADNGKMWGFTNFDGTYGWIFLDQTTAIDTSEQDADTAAKTAETTETAGTAETKEEPELTSDTLDQPQQTADSVTKNENKSLFSDPMILFIPLILIAVILAAILGALLARRK